MVYEYWRAELARLKPFDKYSHWRKEVKRLKLGREAKVRLEWMIYYQTKGGGNVLKTARHFGITPKTFYKWHHRFNEKNLASLLDQSKAPFHVRRRAITPLEEERIVTLRKSHLRWGKMKLRVIYRQTYNEEISSWKVQYTIEKYQLYYHPGKNEKLRQKRKHNQAKKRITELKKKDFPGFLIALDTIVRYWNGQKRYILTAIDTVSKIAFARMYTTKSSKNAGDFIQRVAYLLDYELWNTCHDNGSEFKKHFQEAIVDLKLDDYWSRTKTPKDNPINERFNRTLKEEFLDFGNMTADTTLFNQRLTEWLIEYNFVRPHQSLGYDTPWKFYQETAKVLPMYSSRTLY